MKLARNVLSSIVAIAVTAGANGEESTRLLRFPDLHGDQVIFTFADDVWLTTTSGGAAKRLTSLAANKFAARFSPDGKSIAFTAERGGNYDVYVVHASGGEARRLTWHPMPDFVVGWTRDSAAVLFRSRRTSFTHPVDHLFTVPATGGMPTELPLSNAGPAAFSPSGAELVYTANPIEGWNPPRRYRGGRHARLAVYDLARRTQYDLAPSDANDVSPSWVGSTIYFASDRSGSMNLFAFDVPTRALTQITRERESDIRQPTVTADGRAIYAKAGRLYLLDLRTRREVMLNISPVGPFPERQPRAAPVAPHLTSFALSADATHALVSARGEVFAIDPIRRAVSNLMASSGAREHSAVASPDGRWIAYISDVTGEYEIYLRAITNGVVRRLTMDGRGYRDGLRWSPDSRHLLFTDETLSLSVIEIATGAQRRIAQSQNGPIEHYEWAPDSASLLYTKVSDNLLGRLYRHDIAGAVSVPITDGMTDDFNPVIDAAGERVYFLSARNLRTSFSDFEQTFNFNDTVGIYSMPFDEKDASVRRMSIEPSSLSHLSFAAGSLLYLRRDRATGSVSLHAFDLASARDRIVATAISDYAVRGDTLLILRDTKLSWQTLDGLEPRAEHELASVTMQLDPVAEWRQIFLDTWRLQRDYFYEPTMNGVDWLAVRNRYEQQLPSVATREDLNVLLTQMVGELGVSHSWVVGGETSRHDAKAVGVLAADLVRDGAHHRVAHVYRGDEETRSPLRDAGIAPGSLLLAIGGRALTTTGSIEERLEGTVGQQIELTIRTPEGVERLATVTPIGNDMPLRYIDWVAANRARVLESTGGRCGYVHVPNTGRGGIAAFAKQFIAHSDKDALIVDIRWNSGGLFPASMIEHLRRITLAREASRHGNDLRIPGLAVEGPKVLLANQNTISGGDSFAIYFRRAALGPIIGTRTAGATIGNVGMPSLVDGGEVAVAALAYWERGDDGVGRWAYENRGVVPDLEVVDAYDREALEPDPQLAKAIEVIRKQLDAAPRKPTRPPPPSH
jgi:tricorn protease